MSKPVYEVFKEAVDYLTGNKIAKNKKEIAASLGVSPSYFSEILNNRINLSGELIQKFLNEWPVNPMFIFSFSKEVLAKNVSGEAIDEYPSKSTSPSLGLPRVVTVDSAEQDNVVLVPVKARAGYLLGYGDPEYIGTLPGYRFPNVRGGTFRAFEVEGHSMTPTLKNGDIVIGEWCERLDHIMDDRVYVIVTKNEGIVIKRVFNLVSHDGIIVAKSDAASLGEVYRNIEIDPANILELWHVRSFLSADLSFPSSVYDRLDSMEAKIKALESRFGPPT